MTQIIDGRKAEIIDAGETYSTYVSFAKKHDYPDAAADIGSTDNRRELTEGETVTLLVSGPHEWACEGTLWIVETADKQRYIIGEKGLRILDNVGITVCADESLGGSDSNVVVLREYTEVKRKAIVGERIKVLRDCAHVVQPAAEVTELTADESTNPLDRVIADLAALALRVSKMETQLKVAREDIVLIEEGVSDDIERLKAELAALKITKPPREPKVGDRVVIVDRCATNIGDACPTLKNGETCVITIVDETYRCPYNINGIWCYREAFVFADEQTEAVTLPAPTPQFTRDDVIERAKVDVAELTTKVYGGGWYNSGIPAFEEHGPMTFKFVVNRDKKTVVATGSYKHFSNEIATKGIAKCSPGDVFNTHIGRAIALRRALGLEVPDEYVNAPQPTEPRVGDVVHVTGLSWTMNRIDTLSRRRPEHDGSSFGKLAFMTEGSGGWIADKQFRIIDDSRENTEVAAA